MKIESTELDGLHKITHPLFQDVRGSFSKRYIKSFFKENRIDWNFTEEYYSISNKNVIRGMHFQNPPYEHNKMVYVIRGCVLDVVLDLRLKSKTYGTCFSITLNDETPISLLIPAGCAHGFLSLTNDTIMMYKVTSEYNQESDSGILWSSIPFEWPVKEAIVSKRDSEFSNLINFKSVFK